MRRLAADPSGARRGSRPRPRRNGGCADAARAARGPAPAPARRPSRTRGTRGAAGSRPRSAAPAPPRARLLHRAQPGCAVAAGQQQQPAQHLEGRGGHVGVVLVEARRRSARPASSDRARGRARATSLMRLPSRAAASCSPRRAAPLHAGAVAGAEVEPGLGSRRLAAPSTPRSALSAASTRAGTPDRGSGRARRAASATTRDERRARGRPRPGPRPHAPRCARASRGRRRRRGGPWPRSKPASRMAS